MPRQPQQGTLFDEQCRQTAEQVTWWAEGLRQDLHEAQTDLASLEAENAELRQQVQRLTKEKEWAELRLAALQGSLGHTLREVRTETEADSKARLVRALTRLAAEVHPDRHGGSEVAEECTKAVLRLRDSLGQ